MSAKKNLLYEFSSFLGMSLTFGLCVASCVVFFSFLSDRLVDTLKTFETYMKYWQDRYEKDVLEKLKIPIALSNPHSPNLTNDAIKILTSKKIVISSCSF